MENAKYPVVAVDDASANSQNEPGAGDGTPMPVSRR